jgi:hypothetical protein
VIVEALVLDGWPEGDRDRIADAFRRELARLLARRLPRPLAAGDGPGEAVDAGTFAASRRPATVGEAVARRVYDALGRRDDPRRPGRPVP